MNEIIHKYLKSIYLQKKLVGKHFFFNSFVFHQNSMIIKYQQSQSKSNSSYLIIQKYYQTILALINYEVVKLLIEQKSTMLNSVAICIQILSILNIDLEFRYIL